MMKVSQECLKSGFKNTFKVDFNNIEELLELASNECTIKYDNINLYYDENTKMYKIAYSMIDTLRHCESIYIDHQGITQIIVYGE